MSGYPPQPGSGNQGNYQQQPQYGQGNYQPQYQPQQQQYQQQPYGHQYHQQPQQAGSVPGIVIAGFILSFLCPLVGVILCAVGMSEAKRRNAGTGLATAGLIIGGVFLLINVLAFFGGAFSEL